MYLFVAADKELAEVPEDLLQRFGTPEETMTLLLTPERKLARSRVEDVAAQIREQGYFLQLPPLPRSDMSELANRNDKLPR